jgi:hypothetical protein
MVVVGEVAEARAVGGDLDGREALVREGADVGGGPLGGLRLPEKWCGGSDGEEDAGQGQGETGGRTAFRSETDVHRAASGERGLAAFSRFPRATPGPSR